MAETTVGTQIYTARKPGRLKFIIGGVAVIGAIIWLAVAAFGNNSQYFHTVDEIKAGGSALVGRNLRASGAVLGSTITYDPATLTITFEMAQVSNDAKDVEAAGGLAEILHLATTNPNAARITVVYVGPKPDLLKDEAQAIVTGKLGQDGVFYADELLLKCPTRYEEALPDQSQG